VAYPQLIVVTPPEGPATTTGASVINCCYAASGIGVSLTMIRKSGGCPRIFRKLDQCSTVVGCVAEVQHVGMPAQNRVNDLALNSSASAMDDSDVAKTLAHCLVQVFFSDPKHLEWHFTHVLGDDGDIFISAPQTNSMSYS
jgi:hypothetical protein